jgi:hypothetical protein
MAKEMNEILIRDKQDQPVNQFPTRPEFKQFRRKSNEVVQAAYAMYLTGKSIEEVARVYKKTRQAMFSQFQVRGFPLRSKQLKGLQVYDGIQFTETKGGYLRGTLADKSRVLMHRYVWEKESRTKIPTGWDIHHKNCDKQDNRFENLECLPKAEHTRKYSPHHNQFTAPNGSKRKKGDRLKAEREARWKRVLAI